MRWLLLMAALAAFPAAAPAQVTRGLGLSAKDANAPIQVSADRFDADLNAKSGVYSGNVLIVQGDMRLRADKVRITTVAGKPDKIFADGNVVFDAPSGSAKGDTGVYDVNPRLITFSGRVVLIREKNVMRGSVLVVNLITGQAQLGAKGMSGGRVQGLFVPPPSNPQPHAQPLAPQPAQTPPRTNP
ncbi:MAG: lipopolysaccharide transport periplasmic protein LptA [Alphaproteobacteria bacterium]|nr:lipopolysaccharide transport periplasmic protein LptA [Alphaproteobacteria bacterium]MBV9693809.1 lipopolysaccharide transport periplasmic protein LptA [Alphaproteobacteria bacterium]